jgi:hypothetical protein
MITYDNCANLKIDGDEYTAGFLGLHWFPSSVASGNQAHYERAVIQNLETIIGTQTGLAVLNGIGNCRHATMFIRPYHATAAFGALNATATPTDVTAATLRDTTALDQYGNLPAAGERRIVGTGTGSDSIVNYTPGIFATATSGAGPGGMADEILLHEMVHGLRQMMGRWVRERVNGNPGMDNHEEFTAIVISNVYRSERGIPRSRRDHHGYVPLAGDVTNPAIFRTTFSQYLSYMDIEMPGVCALPRRATCSFNPF